MQTLTGQYQDGSSTEAFEATLEQRDGLILVCFLDQILEIEPEQLKVSDRLGSTPRNLSWGTRERFVTRHNDEIDELIQDLGIGNRSGWIAKLESKTHIAVAAAIVAFGFAILFAIFGVPAIARTVALNAPASVSNQLAESTMVTLDRILEPTELLQERQDQLTEYFRSYADVEHIRFRKAEDLGANALCLSGTTVVFTDELIKLAENDEELLAVYLHEIGHAELRHVETSILQNSAWVVLFSVLVGDFSGAGELIVSLPLVVGQMAYSRELEREADQYAIDAMLAAGLDPGSLATILEKLENSHTSTGAIKDEVTADEVATESGAEADAEGDDVTAEHTEAQHADTEAAEAEEDSEDNDWAETVFEYLSTHPATEERLAHIRSFSRESGN